MRAVAVAGLTSLLTVSVMAQGQPPAAFEVVSIRENTSASERTFFSGPTPGRFTVTNFPLRFLLGEAFQARAHELVGAPSWTEEARFDITATYPAGAVPQRDMRPMLQRTLADRFGLKFHRETREMPVYNLRLAKNDGTLGPRMKESTTDCEQLIAANPKGPRTDCISQTSRRTMMMRSQEILSMLGPLQALSGRPIVDRTGLRGRYNVDLEWATSGDLGVTGPDAQGVSLFAAIEEQLGLKLEPSRAPFEVIVVEAISRPTPD